MKSKISGGMHDDKRKRAGGSPGGGPHLPSPLLYLGGDTMKDLLEICKKSLKEDLDIMKSSVEEDVGIMKKSFAEDVKLMDSVVNGKKGGGDE